MKEEFTGNLKDLIVHMITNDADCCEVTNTVGDVSVTVEVTIKKITDGDNVLYDAEDEADELEFVTFDDEDAEYLS